MSVAGGNLEHLHQVYNVHSVCTVRHSTAATVPLIVTVTGYLGLLGSDAQHGMHILQHFISVTMAFRHKFNQPVRAQLPVGSEPCHSWQDGDLPTGRPTRSRA